MKILLRTKLIISFILVVLTCGLVATLVGVRLIGDGIIHQTQDKVRTDLNSAREMYNQKMEKVKDIVFLTSLRFFLGESLRRENFNILNEELDRILENERLDILTITDEKGVVLYRAGKPESTGDDQSENALVNIALKNKAIVASTEIVPREELFKENEQLARRARIEVISTPKAKVKTSGLEDSGMMIKAAAPIIDRSGRLLGVLYGGILLNKNYELVDKIKETVYQGEVYKGKDIGTATIFQGDLRISTNVTRADGSRAIGTRVSEEVYDQVIEKGVPWIERAFVVNNWYITAYEPVKNISGEIIGMLYVGILEEKFTDMRKATMWVFLGITFAGIVVALLLSYLLANGILKPIKRLVVASEQIAQGDLAHKVHVTYSDEIGKLGNTFNYMAASLRDRDERLKERAQATIMQSERLATIGQLAAGVAHEMNNPLGGILLYANLLLEKKKEEDQTKEDLQRIVNETERCRKIVRGLLDFSRQTKLEMSVVELNRILENTLDLATTQAVFKNIQLNRKLNPALPRVLVDIGQMQQVFINIILNAAEAMDGTGTLNVITDVSEDDSFITITFEDSGPGIAEEHIKKIFDPFFTTKPMGKGTGLGLSIAFGIVRKHNGTIKVNSEEGKGSSFTIKLPVMNDPED